MREIVDEMRRLLTEPDGGALVTITRTTGSTYRREGAKMICRKDGEMVGSISGGCLESDVYEVSRGVVERDRPEIVTYDTNAENENVWGLGLGCNGTVEVLVEPLSWWRTVAGRGFFTALTERVDRGRQCAVATLLTAGGTPLPTIDRILVDPDGGTVGTLPEARLERTVAERARAILATEVLRPSRRITLSEDAKTLEVFIDALVPPTRLLVVGGGHDAIPLVRLARETGFVVTLVDSRPQFATAERFPEADAVLCVQPETFADEVSLEGRPAVVLMTHNYLKDRVVLGQLLRCTQEFLYIGALGPRARTEQMLSELRAQGLDIPPERAAAVTTPIGLDIGADSPAEIALALLAELLAVKNRRQAMRLRDKKGAIHEAA